MLAFLGAFCRTKGMQLAPTRACPYGQWVLNSDAKIADEGRAHKGGGHPQGVPLRDAGFLRSVLHAKGGCGCAQGRVRTAVAFELGRAKYSTKARAPRGRAPTRGAPTGCWQPQEVLSLVDCSCPERSVGQSHLNSDAKIVYEGRAHDTGGEGHAQGVSVRDAGSLRRFCRWCDAVGRGVL